jgi:hypothetical protein
MRSARLVALLLLAVFLFTQLELKAAQPPAWKCGVTRVKITPEKPFWMAGYGARKHPAEGTYQDLWVKCLALETPDGGRALVVTSDLLGFSREVSEGICSGLATSCGLERSRVMLTSSHTHSGPVLLDALYDIYPLDDAQHALIKEYSAALVP